MKRIKVFLSLLCIGLVATGCKGSTESSSVETPVNGDSQGVEEVTQQISDYRPEIYCSLEYLFDEAVIDGEYTPPYLSGHIENFSLSPETKDTYPVLSEAFESAMDARTDKYEDIHEEYLDASKQLRESGEEHTFILEADLFLRRSDAKVISFVDQRTEYVAGAHGFTSYDSFNFDVQTGKEISLEDVVADKDAFIDYISQKLVEKYGANTFNDLDKCLAEIDLSDYHWAFDYAGITIYFGNDLAAYAAGELNVNVPYDSEALHKEYALTSGEGIISQIPLYFPEDKHIDIVSEGDGLTIDPGYDPEMEDYYYMQSLTITKNGDSFTLPDLFVWDAKAYIMHTPEGSDYLMIMTKADSDYTSDFVVSLDGKMEQLSNDYFGVGEAGTTDEFYTIVPSDPSRVALDNSFNMLCTFDGTRYYSLESDGKFNPLEKYYRAMLSEQQDLISKVEMTVPIVTEEGEETGEEVTLPAGTHYSIIRTDGDSDVDCTIPDGRIIRFHLEDPNGFGYIDDIEINGVNAYDLFEMLWYAG